MNLKALVIENDPYVREELVEHYKRFIGQVHEAESVEVARKRLHNLKYDVVSIDLNLTDNGEEARDGLKILPMAKSQGALCFILSAYKDRETIGKASSYDPEVLYIKKQNLYGPSGISKEIFNEYIGKPLVFHFQNPLDEVLKNKFVTKSEVLIERLHETFRGALDRTQTIMLLGETGVGKTFLAGVIDEAQFILEKKVNDEKIKRNFQHVNLKAISPEQIEATLFGAKKGSYTHSIEDRKGLFELADGGTLFIDEIGTIPLSIQEKLLVALDPDDDGYFHFRRMGCEQQRKSKFRLMTGTCDNLEELFQKGLLREDFYYRVASARPLEIPPLRERSDDVISLIDFFLEKSPRAISITDEALKSLKEYNWHGNIRQLEKLIKDFTKGRRTEVNKCDLPSHILQNENPLAAKEKEQLFNKNIRRFIQKHGLNECIKIIEQEAFKATMAEVNEQIATTADILGIGRKKAYAIQGRLSAPVTRREHV